MVGRLDFATFVSFFFLPCVFPFGHPVSLECHLSAVPSVVLPILGAVPDGMLKPQVEIRRCATRCGNRFFRW